jgi:hypothetical protein
MLVDHVRWFGGGGGSATMKALLLGVDSINCNTRQKKNDKQIIDVDSMH